MTLTRINSNGITDGSVAPADLSTGAPSWDGSGNQTITGDVTLSGTGKRIKADFSSATVGNRVWFQSTTTNDFTVVGAIPNGTSTAAAWTVANNSTPTNAGIGSLIATDTSVILESSRLGSGTYLPLQFNTNGAEKMRLDTSGRLLVGTSSYSSTATAVLLGNSASATSQAALILQRGEATPADGAALGGVFMQDNTINNSAAMIAYRDGGTWSGTSKPTRLVFSTTADGASSPTERMRIDNAGNILAAGRTAYTSFGTNGIYLGNGGEIYTSITSAAAAGFNRNGTDGTLINFGKGGTAVGTISVTASATAYNTSSDYRLKKNVVPVADGITRLQQLKPSRFNFLADPDTAVDGFIAHEVQEVVPEAITGEKDAVDDDGNPIYQGIDQSKLVPLLTAALQEAIGRIETLEAEVAALKAQ